MLLSSSTFKQSSKKDEMMPDLTPVKRCLIKSSGALVSSSLKKTMMKKKSLWIAKDEGKANLMYFTTDPGTCLTTSVLPFFPAQLPDYQPVYTPTYMYPYIYPCRHTHLPSLPPTYLPACLPTPTYLPTYIHTYSNLPDPTYLHTYPPACLHT